MFNECLEIRWKNCLPWHPQILLLKSFSLRSNIKHETVFHYQMKHLEVTQKYSAARRICNSLRGVLVMKHGVSCLIYYVTKRLYRKKSTFRIRLVVPPEF